MTVFGSQFQLQTAFGTPTVAAGTTPQGSTFAKVDTRLLIDVDASQTVDDSQRATDLTTTGAGGYEATSARMALTSPRCIEVRVTADNSDTGTILAMSDTSGVGIFRLEAVSGNIRLRTDVSGITTIASFDFFQASDKTYVIQWATTLNPLRKTTTEGGPDSGTTYLHEITAYNEDDATYLLAQYLSDQDAASSSDNFAYGGYWDGAALADVFTGTIHKVRIGSRFHSSTELHEDWVASSNAATTEANILDPMLPLGASAALHADTELAGPVYAHAGAVSRQCGQRMLSPLVNIVCNPDDADARVAMLNTYLPVNRWTNVDIAGTTYKAHLGFVWHRPAPPMADRIRVSVHMQVWDNAVTASKTVNVACVSASARPGVASYGPNQIVRNWVLSSRTADDTSSGLGDWLTFSGDIRIARDSDDFTWLYLAFNATDADARWVVHAVSFDPVPYPTGGGSLPLEIGP